MQTVKQVIEELTRFNPEARVDPPVEIKGHSPAVECIIACDRNEIYALESRVKHLEAENGTLEALVDGAKTIIEEAEQGSLEDDEILKKLKELFE